VRVPSIGVTLVHAKETDVHGWTSRVEVTELVIDEPTELIQNFASQVTGEQWRACDPPGGFHRADGADEPHHVVSVFGLVPSHDGVCLET